MHAKVKIFWCSLQNSSYFPSVYKSSSKVVSGCSTLIASAPHQISSWSDEKHARQWSQWALLFVLTLWCPGTGKVSESNIKWLKSMVPISLADIKKIGCTVCVANPTNVLPSKMTGRRAGQTILMILIWIKNSASVYQTCADKLYKKQKKNQLQHFFPNHPLEQETSYASTSWLSNHQQVFSYRFW